MLKLFDAESLQCMLRKYETSVNEVKKGKFEKFNDKM